MHFISIVQGCQVFNNLENQRLYLFCALLQNIDLRFSRKKVMPDIISAEKVSYWLSADFLHSAQQVTNIRAWEMLLFKYENTIPHQKQWYLLDLLFQRSQAP